jgi:hypothetical protein
MLTSNFWPSPISVFGLKSYDGQVIIANKEGMVKVLHEN